MKTEIVKAEDYGLEQSKAEKLTEGLKIVRQERSVLLQEFEEVSKLELAHENLHKFKELRLKFVKNRTQGVNKWHKANKEFFLTGGKFVDAIKNMENQINEQAEEKLMAAEKHFENIEKERLRVLEEKRKNELSKYVDSTDGLVLSEMQEDVWQAFLSVKKKAYEEKIALEKKAEEERKEQERKQKVLNNRLLEIAAYGDHAPMQPSIETSEEDYKNLLAEAKKNLNEYNQEQERIRVENERLKKEREEAEKKAKIEQEKREKEEQERQKKLDEERKQREEKEKKEREEYEAKLKKQREEKEKAEAELRKAKEEAERKEREEAAQKEAELKKGDSEKFNDLLNDLELLKSKYSFKSEENKKKYKEVVILLDKIINHIK